MGRPSKKEPIYISTPDCPVEPTKAYLGKEVGRPSAYNPKLHPLLIESLMNNGLTLKQVAEKLGVDRSTIEVWRNRFPAVNEAIKKGKAPVDKRVVSALYRSAIGYTYDEVVKEPRALTEDEIAEKRALGEALEKPLEVTKKTRKYMAPNVLAQMFFLKNRMPDDWKDRSSVNLSGKIEYEVTLPPKPEELAKRVEGETKIGEEPKVEILGDIPDTKEKVPRKRKSITQIPVLEGIEDMQLGMPEEIKEVEPEDD